MTVGEYRASVRRFGVLGITLFFGISIPLMGLGLFGAHSTAQSHNWLTKFLASWVRPDLLRPAVFLIFLPVLCAPFILSTWALHWLDRRIGCRCEHCGCSLILRCDPKLIILEEHCPKCGMSVIDLAT